MPLIIAGPGIEPGASISGPTSHVDLIPTLLGLADIDVEQAAHGVALHHTEAQPLPGRDLSKVVVGKEPVSSLESPIYFMTEDAVSRGGSQTNVLTGKPFEPVPYPTNIESVVGFLPTGPDGSAELWKLNHYYERLDAWYADRGVAANPFAGPAAEPNYELHNLSRDPSERDNRYSEDTAAASAMLTLLETERDAKRRIPALRN